MSSRIVGWGLLLLLGCSRAPTPPTVTPSTASDGSASSSETTETEAPERCETAACHVERSRAARDAGALDVASAHLGAAYRLDPSEAALVAWVEALQQAGRHRRVAQVLDAQAERHPSAVQALRRVAAPPGSDAPLSASEPSAQARPL